MKEFKIKAQYDTTTKLLLLFILLLASLFFYLSIVEQSIQHYSKQNRVLTSLRILDHEFNDFSQTINHFSNYDIVEHKAKLFEERLETLSRDLLNSYPNNTSVKKTVQHIKKLYASKEQEIERFKSLNATLISGSHLLFDLQRTITTEASISSEAKSLVNETLFFMMQYTTGRYIDKATITDTLTQLKPFIENQKLPYLNNFYSRVQALLQIITQLKSASSKIYNSALGKDLTHLERVIYSLYTKNFVKQIIITVLFFIMALGISIALIISHLRTLKTKRELLAFQYAMQHSDNTVVITDASKHITFVNDIFEKTTGYALQEALGKNPNILKSGKQDDSFYKEMNIKLARGEKWEGEFINKRKDGSLFYEKASIVPVFLNDKLINYLAIKLDITKYVEQNRKLAQAASVYENTEEAIVIADGHGKVTSVNNAFTKMYGYTLDDLKGKNLSLLHSGVQNANFYANMWHQLIVNGIWRGKIINKTKDGKHIPVWSTIKKITDNKGNAVNYTAIQTDLRELEQTQKKANYLAYHDPLTGLYNRTNFEEYLHHALSLAKRNEGRLAVLFIDLDRFKIINDTLGHDVGDQVLIEIAKRLKETLRESDFISRWGGDEFVTILENIQSPSEVATVATNIINNLKRPITVGVHHLVTTASVGISLYPENGVDKQTLIKHADSAMYFAKEMGKNRFQYYTTQLSQEVEDRMDIDMQLRNAVANKEMFIYFQPQYDLKTKKIRAAEALVRWNNAKLGFVSPEKFIPIAEESGIIIPLGYYIFEESCRALKEMKEASLHLERLAINVSSIQLKESNLLERFLNIVKKYQLSPHEIEIELTERLIMEQTKANSQLLERFRAHGFKISIDDFGTGYSSMAYLQHLPVDTLKIDKSFVDDINKKDSDNVIVNAIIALSKALGYAIVAEGIEEKGQENFLREAGCDLGQGYIFSKPITQEEMIQRFTT